MIGFVLVVGPGLRAAELFSEKRVVNQLGSLPQQSRYRLAYPSELLFGPDDFLDVTEKTGRVSRVDPATGTRRVLLTIPDVLLTLKRDTAGWVTQVGQDGLLSLSLHPNFRQGTGQDFVWLAYVYDNEPGPAVQRRARIVRYGYTGGSAPTLRNPRVVLQGLPAGDDHSSGRLLMGSDGKLYYTCGDLGGNQFANTCGGVRSQNTPTETELAGGNTRTTRARSGGSIRTRRCRTAVPFSMAYVRTSTRWVTAIHRDWSFRRLRSTATRYLSPAANSTAASTDRGWMTKST